MSKTQKANKTHGQDVESHVERRDGESRVTAGLKGKGQPQFSRGLELLEGMSQDFSSFRLKAQSGGGLGAKNI